MSNDVKRKINVKDQTPIDARMFLIYLIENPEYITKIEPDKLFDDSLNKTIKDFKNVYTIIYDYFIEYDQVPTETIIKTEIDKKNLDITRDYLKKILDRKDYTEILENRGEDYIKNKIREQYYLKQQDYTLRNGIDIHRKGELIPELKGEDPFDDTEEEDEPDLLKQTLTIPEDIYLELPDYLRRLTDIFEDNRSKDILLTSQLIILSSLFNNIQGIYHGKPYTSNLFGFISGPASSGKGIMSFSFSTLQKIKEQERDENNSNRMKYSPEEYKEKDIKEKHIQIAGDSSGASIVNSLYNNGGHGLIFETEADTITNNKKQDWGDYTDKIRSSFHHEPIIVNRKLDGRIEIDKPRLSVCLSGTINQLLKYIGSSENGLFSRFIYYLFDQEINWKTPFNIEENIEYKFESELGQELLDIYNTYKSFDKLMFRLTDKQKLKFDEFFKELVEYIKTFYIDENDISANVFRIGLVCFRICMILTILRSCKKRNENNLFNIGTEDVLECSDIDLDISLTLVSVYFKHTEFLYKNLRQTDQVVLIEDDKEKLFNKMPGLFSRKDILKQGEKYKNMSDTTIDRLLRNWKKQGIIVKDKHMFKKTKRFISSKIQDLLEKEKPISLIE